MTYKHALITFSILMAAGMGGYIAVNNGFYPIAVVDLKIITNKAAQENYAAAFKYYQNAYLAYGNDPAKLEDLNVKKEIRRATLDKLVIDALIFNELKRRLPDEFESIAEVKIQQYIKDNNDIQKAAQTLYGLDFAQFKEKVLLPQAYREILEGRMFLEKQDFNKWLENEKSAANILILTPDLQWKDNKVELHD